MAVHICWSCSRGRNPVILSPLRPCQTQQGSTPTQKGRFHNKYICYSRVVASLQAWLRRGWVLHLGSQEGRAKWKLRIQTESQRCGPEDVTPLIHSASDTAARLTATSGDARITYVLKEMAPSCLKLIPDYSSVLKSQGRTSHYSSLFCVESSSSIMESVLPGLCWMISQLASEHSYAGRGKGEPH